MRTCRGNQETRSHRFRGIFNVFGSGFVFGNGRVSAGTISGATHTNADGSVTHQTITGANADVAALALITGSPGTGSALLTYMFLLSADQMTGHDGVGDKLNGFGGNDTISGGSGADELYGGDGNDVLYGNNDSDHLEGGAGNDTLYGGDGGDLVRGGIGNDQLSGGAGYESVEGEEGDDTILVAQGDVGALFGGSSFEAFNGGHPDAVTEFDTLVVGGTNDFHGIYAPGLSRTTIIRSFEALTFDDTLGPSAINDATFGWNHAGGMAFSTGLAITGDSTAADTLRFLTTGENGFNGDASSVNFNGSGFTFTNWGANDRVFIETNGVPTAVTVIGTSQADQITGGNHADTLTGGGGIDTISGASGNDTLYGGDGDDNISGDGGADFMYGGLGDDRFVVDTYAGEAVVEFANEGTDVVYATIDYTVGANIEQIIMVEGSAAVNAGGGDTDNVIIGNSAANVIYAYGGNDVISGGDGDDSLLGMDGNNAIDGQGGNDQMIGGLGDDSFVINSISDAAAEFVNQGIDTVYAEIDYTLGGNIEQLILREGTAAVNGAGGANNNTIIGNSAINTIYGNDGADTLYGFANNDVLVGGNGADIFDGGTGNDNLSGNADADIFKFAAGDGVDIINDFSHAQGDQLVISSALAADFAALTAAGTTVNGDGVFLFAGGQTITLTGVAHTSLVAGDVLFF